jgi:hypothetical protein
MKNLQTIVASLIIAASAVVDSNAQHSPVIIQSAKPSPNTEYHRTYTGKDRFMVGDISTYVSGVIANPPSRLSQSEKDYKRFTDKYRKQVESIVSDINVGNLATASDKVLRMKKSLEPESKGKSAYAGFAREYLELVNGFKVVEFEFYNMDVVTTTRNITDRTWPLAVERAPASVISGGLELATKPLDMGVAALLGRDVGKAARFRSPKVYWDNVTEKEFHPISRLELFDVKEYRIGDKVSNWRLAAMGVQQVNAPAVKQNYLTLKLP